MSEVNFFIESKDKEGIYKEFLPQFRVLLTGETEEVSILANASAALRQVFNFFWVGFYLVKNDHLIVGPFQGSVACSNIKYGKGVCGTAWKERQTQVVPDVEQFPGHIACRSLSRSEIVVPLIKDGEVKAVLDIDSKDIASFDETDRLYLEQVADFLVNLIYK